MKYETVNLEEKTVVGLAARTSNTSPEMGAAIGGLWQDFYGKGIYPSIPHKKSEKALGIYTDYAGAQNNEYTVLVACEVEESKQAELPAGTVSHKIPAGPYAKFIVKGHVQKAVAEFWQELWNMDLPRAYTSDFEEYQNGDMEQAEIHIYIALKP